MLYLLDANVLIDANRDYYPRANRHLPDVCRDLGVRPCNTYEFIEELDFTTGGRP